MIFKKASAAIAALALCAGLLTACGGDGGSAENETAASESATDAVSDTAEAAEDTSGTTGIITETTIVSEEALVTEPEETAENPLQPLADAAVSVGEWPSLWEVTDAQMLSDFFLLDAENENYKNMIVLQCPMSANMTEIIIIEADDVEAAKTDLEARRKKAQDQDAFYPDDVDKAAASIVGAEGNYAYFILAYDASDAETALVDAIKALE